LFFPIAKYASETRCWCQNLTIRSSTCRCSRLKILRACWDMLMIFWKVGGRGINYPRSCMTLQTGIFLVEFNLLSINHEIHWGSRLQSKNLLRIKKLNFLYSLAYKFSILNHLLKFEINLQLYC
jgi:hypothetical protein